MDFIHYQDYFNDLSTYVQDIVGVQIFIWVTKAISQSGGAMHRTTKEFWHGGRPAVSWSRRLTIRVNPTHVRLTHAFLKLSLIQTFRLQRNDMIRPE